MTGKAPRSAHHPHRSVASLAAAIIVLATLLFSPPPANAGTVTDDRPFLFSFDGSDTTAGAFTRPDGGIDIDYSTGAVYVIDVAGEGKGPGPFDSKRVVDKFNAEGKAKDFSPTIGSSLNCWEKEPGQEVCFGYEGFFSNGAQVTDVAVDNSGGSGGPGEGEQGRLYVSEATGPIHAFDPDGSYLWTLPGTTVDPCGIAVDMDGHLWVVDQGQEKAFEFASSGSPPAQIGSVSLTANAVPCRPGIDQAGNLYVADRNVVAYVAVQKYVGGTPDSTLTTKRIRELAVNQSSPTGHVFGVNNDSVALDPFTEYDSSGVEVGTFGGDLIVDSRGIAYDPALDQVYVSDLATNTVKVFGPITSGTVPDVAMASSTGITRTEATVHGTVNPQGVPNSYRFQWAVGGEEIQRLEVRANSGTFKIHTEGCCPEFTDPLPFDISPLALQEVLEGLGPIGAGNVSVTGTPAQVDPTTVHGYVPGEYDITFTGELAGVNVEQLRGENINLGGGSPGALLATTAPGPTWGAAQSSPPQSLSADSADHPVSLGLSGLKQNTTYSVRLVGTNTDNDLSAYSAPDIFTTLAPPPPSVSIDSISPITTDSAHFEATINPEEDTTTWRVQRSTDPSCSGGFVDEPLQTIPIPGPGPVAVTYDLTALQPAQTYCVRLTATNAGGTTTTAGEVIQTLAIPPTGAQTTFAAPRTDTTARINARVNPQGEADLTYRFELSKDDGASWIPLPERVFDVEAREPVLVADELSGLDPDTTYHYRLAAAFNSAGQAPGLPGGEKSFTTRTAAEMAMPPNAFGQPGKRGIELVNNPDKGNQNVARLETKLGDPPIRPNGNEALWTVPGGAPGAYNGVISPFLAERAAEGWRSRSLAPPAAQQVGGGGLGYVLEAATPGYSRFVFGAQKIKPFGSATELTRVRLDAHQNQEILREYAWQEEVDQPSSLDLTDDGTHVLAINNENKQLEDIGDGASTVVSLMPDGEPSACGMVSTSGASFVGGHSVVNPEPPRGVSLNWRPGYHMMDMAKASLVYFEVKPNGDCAGKYGLYVRDRDAEETTLIDDGSGQDVAFIRATPDGRFGYFTTNSKLDPTDANGGVDIYRWDQESKESTCLTCVVPDANVRFPVMVSGDFSHIYFESTNQLVPGQGTPGTASVYTLSDDAIRFVAKSSIFNPVLALGTAESQLSRDGSALLFRASGALNLTADKIAAGEQLYRYDDSGASFECLSCVPDGATTESGVTGEFKMSADGSTVAFATAAALTPLDVNRDTDIYEWRNGALRLITDGVSDFPEEFAGPIVRGIDANGANILFSVTAPGWTGFEEDGFANLYVARVGGGFEPPAPPTHCVEDSCQGPLRPAPPLDRSASSAFSGRGNLSSAPNRCGARKLRRAGRCVPKRALARRACRKRKGKAKRRCVRRQMRRLNRIQKRQLRNARVQAKTRGTG